MPAEWEPHENCYLSWPCRESTWRGHRRGAKKAYLDVIRKIALYEPIVVLSDPETLEEARTAIGKEAEVLAVELDDSWARDNGPIFIRRDDGKVAMVSFEFNGWGNKGPYEKDRLLPQFLAHHLGVKMYRSSMVLEGGSISVDEDGTLLTTEQCLLNRNRNPRMSKEEIEQNLQDYLGTKKIIWLWKGVEGDITDGHVDGVASFVSPHTVLAMSTDDRDDPNQEALRENVRRLESLTDVKGRSFEVVKMIQPRPMEFCGQVITPCYVNFYIANGGVIAPMYGIPEDRIALDILQTVFPNREVVGAYAAYIELGGGAIHCITQQKPRGPVLSSEGNGIVIEDAH